MGNVRIPKCLKRIGTVYVTKYVTIDANTTKVRFVYVKEKAGYRPNVRTAYVYRVYVEHEDINGSQNDNTRNLLECGNVFKNLHTLADAVSATETWLQQKLPPVT